MKWQILSQTKDTKNIVDILLENRDLTTQADKEIFFNPKVPNEIGLEEFGIPLEEIKKTLKRIKKALSAKEKILVYGDYDAYGVCSTAILWEALYAIGLNVVPYIPDRFVEGYGLNSVSLEKIKNDHPDVSLIFTVDNGIVANEAVAKANDLGIDVIISDHHLPGDTLPKAHAIIHTVKTSGAGIAWVMSREIQKEFFEFLTKPSNSLDLAAIGVIADQMPLLGINRSFAIFGIQALQKTTRPGLNCLFSQAAITKQDLNSYHINYIIAPRINAMGRLKHGIDSLRFLCTKDEARARELANLISETNEDRQKVVEKVIVEAKTNLGNVSKRGVLTLASENYHEGVIGLAAAKLVEEFYLPAIVFSVGDKLSKASARSITGFNIIEVLRQLSDLWVEGGGHAMAAGFTIQTEKIAEFSTKLNEISAELLTDELLERKVKIDVVLDFGDLNWELAEKLQKFEPFGLGNPGIVFATFGAQVAEAKVIGNGAKHLKLKLKKEKIFDAIFFGGGEKFNNLKNGDSVDIAYALEVNEWNGSKSLQLKIKDLKLANGEPI